MKERWKQHPEFALYEVSDLGRVRNGKGKIMRSRPRSRNNRYLCIWLRRGDKYHARYVHRLVLEAWRGPCPVGMEGTHGDGRQLNNELRNLTWKTPVANAKDKNYHGTALIGERNPIAVLTERKVLRIREEAAKGGTFTKLAAKYGVSRQNISGVVKGKFWSHVRGVTL